MRFINMELIRSPYNWATIVLMVFFGLFLVSMISAKPAE